MSKKPRRLAISTICVILLVMMALPGLAVTAQDQTQITFWHAMSGSRAEVVQALVDGFNEANPDVNLVAEFTGSYAETLTKALTAASAGEAPNIVQVYEVGTRTMLDSGVIVPVMEVSGGTLDQSIFVQPILNYYALDGELRCMPFNSSTAMLYYNKDMFEAAGLDPDKPPTTFSELYEMGKQIIDSGVAAHAISFGWPAWIMEQMFAMHDQFLADQNNGRDGLATELYLNSEFGVKVLTEWQKWANDGVLFYGGRTYSANDPFIAGEFAMLAQSTSSLGGIQKKVDFELGTAFLSLVAVACGQWRASRTKNMMPRGVSSSIWPKPSRPSPGTRGRATSRPPTPQSKRWKPRDGLTRTPTSVPHLTRSWPVMTRQRLAARCWETS